MVLPMTLYPFFRRRTIANIPRSPGHTTCISDTISITASVSTSFLLEPKKLLTESDIICNWYYKFTTVLYFCSIGSAGYPFIQEHGLTTKREAKHPHAAKKAKKPKKAPRASAHKKPKAKKHRR